MQKHCWPEVHKLQNRARHYNLAKPWWDTSLERHLRYGHLPWHFHQFPMWFIWEKKLFPIISAHYLPVLEMLSNETKRLKMKKIKFEDLEKKNPEIRHLPTNQSPSNEERFPLSLPRTFLCVWIHCYDHLTIWLNHRPLRWSMIVYTIQYMHEGIAHW